MGKQTQPWAIESAPQWKRRAREAVEQSRRMLDAVPPHMRDIGDPNHPAHSGLFGQETAAFMKRQSKKG